MHDPGGWAWLLVGTGRDVISRSLESAVLIPKPRLSLHKQTAVTARPRARRPLSLRSESQTSRLSEMLPQLRIPKVGVLRTCSVAEGCCNAPKSPSGIVNLRQPLSGLASPSDLVPDYRYRYYCRGLLFAGMRSQVSKARQDCSELVSP